MRIILRGTRILQAINMSRLLFMSTLPGRNIDWVLFFIEIRIFKLINFIFFEFFIKI
jgi:hypothetical protein